MNELIQQTGAILTQAQELLILVCFVVGHRCKRAAKADFVLGNYCRDDRRSLVSHPLFPPFVWQV